MRIFAKNIVDGMVGSFEQVDDLPEVGPAPEWYEPYIVELLDAGAVEVTGGWPLPARPSAAARHFITDGVVRWHDPRTLQQAKDQARARVKAGRDVAEMAPFECSGRIYDADDAATRRITGATTGAMMASMASEPFSKEFTLADNTTVLLDGAEMMAVGAALIAKVGAVFDTGRALQAAIEAATSNADADAIMWPSND